MIHFVNVDFKTLHDINDITVCMFLTTCDKKKFRGDICVIGRCHDSVSSSWKLIFPTDST